MSIWDMITVNVNDYFQSLNSLGDEYSCRHQGKYHHVKVIMMVVAPHWDIETFGKSSGYNVEKGLEILTIWKRNQVSFDTFKFIKAHFASPDIMKIMTEFNKISIQQVERNER